MPLASPSFVQGDAIDAVAEFREFVLDVGPRAAAFLAEITELQDREGPPPAADIDATGVRDLCCRKLGGWAVFYTSATKPRAFRLIVLLVARNPRCAFASLEMQAERRMRRV